MSLLEISALTCSVRSHSHLSLKRKTKEVLQEVSFCVEEGTTVGLLGASGSGKSTLGRCIAGLQQPDTGEITYNGINLFPQSENRRRIPLDIQLLFQATGASLNPMMTVDECITEGIEARNRVDKNKGRMFTAEELIHWVGLNAELLRRFPPQLSGGQRQRVALGRALAAQPSLLVLDEPTSALDTITQKQILDLLKRLQAEQKFSILFITHDTRSALMFCDRIVVLHDGRIAENETAQTMLISQKHPYTRQLFSDSRISS